MDMMYRDRAVIVFHGVDEACGFPGNAGSSTYYSCMQTRKEPEKYVLDGVRLERVSNADGDGGRMYIPLTSARAASPEDGAALPLAEVTDRIIPGCTVIPGGVEDSRGMKVLEVHRMSGGSRRLDHLKLILG